MNILLSLFKVLQHPLNKKRPVYTLAKLLFWKCNQLFFKWPVIISVNQTVKCICYPDSSFGGLVVYTTSPEYIEHRLFELLVEPDTTVLDVGANIGFVSLLSAVHTKKMVFSFEIDTRVLEMLYENIRLNNFSGKISVIEAAVSDKTGSVSFKSETTSETSHIGYPQDHHVESTKTVKSVGLDDFIKVRGIKGPLLVKIDVEGAELMVFRGMKRILKNKRAKAVLFEINKNCQKYGYSAGEMISLITANKYSIINLDTRQELQAADIYGMKGIAVNVLAIDTKQITKAKILSLLSRI